MKRQLSVAVIIAVMLAATLMSCGRGAVDTEEDKKFVGFTLPSIGNDFLLALSEDVKAAVEAEGARIQVDSADGDVTTQIEQIENYITMGTDLIVVFAINGEAVSNVCKQAQEAGIPVVAFAVEIPGGVVSTVISADDREMGAACAKMAEAWMEDIFPKAGDGQIQVLLLGSSMTPQIVRRTEGLKEIAENPKVVMKYIETENQDSVDECRKKVENAFAEYADYDVIMCVNGTAAIAAEAFCASPSSTVTDISQFGIFCIDETEEVDSKIADTKSALRGTISLGSIQQSVEDLSKAIVPILKGEEPPRYVNGTISVITSETLQENRAEDVR